ncbi:MAG: helix-turn-helix domain-containing protein [Pseudobdellovibrionaceae bacterium]
MSLLQKRGLSLLLLSQKSGVSYNLVEDLFSQGPEKIPLCELKKILDVLKLTESEYCDFISHFLSLGNGKKCQILH